MEDASASEGGRGAEDERVTAQTVHGGGEGEAGAGVRPHAGREHAEDERAAQGGTGDQGGERRMTEEEHQEDVLLHHLNNHRYKEHRVEHFSSSVCVVWKTVRILCLSNSLRV